MFLPKQVLVGVRNTTFLRVGPPLSPFVSIHVALHLFPSFGGCVSFSGPLPPFVSVEAIAEKK